MQDEIKKDKDTGPELEKLAKALGVTGAINSDLTPDDDDIDLLHKYHALPQECRDYLRALIRWQYIQTL